VEKSGSRSCSKAGSGQRRSRFFVREDALEVRGWEEKEKGLGKG
jgi:hypothetical protein